MTDEQYQKRIQFLDYIKKNYVAVKDHLWLFYFEDYDLSTIRTELVPPSEYTYEYYKSRRQKNDGAVSLSYDYDGLIYLNLTDSFVDIMYNISHSYCEFNDIHMPLDMKKVAAELKDLFELLKSK
jgi:hypothetical protein